MNWNDLLRMSINSLRRRKLRTFLTVLGVLIGTASIVVMISLGLGMQQSMYKEVERSGGLTSIKVRTSESDGIYDDTSKNTQDSKVKRIDDKLISEIQKMDHVKMVSPTYEISAILLKGSYIANIQLKAMNQEGLMAQNLELGSGTLPKSGSGQLSLIFGNGVLIDFNEKGSGRGYYDTGKVPDIDLTKDSMFLITDTEAYNSDQGNAVFGGAGIIAVAVRMHRIRSRPNQYRSM